MQTRSSPGVFHMAHSIPFGARSTADEVLAGVDLSRKRFLVTECDTGIGFETMNALAANGAHVIGLARTLRLAQAACAAAGTACTPIACDSMNLESVAAAAALYAKELSRRLASRGVAVNSLHPGANKAGGRSTRLDSLPLFPPISRLFMKSSAQAAATHVLLAASPRVEGITGEYWSDCKIARGNPRLTDTGLGKRLWEASEQMTLSITAERHVLHEAA
jgi:NAD(P)-dependent dehydrogenase (short-subunit alcohol dehydrogenase family)